MPGFLKGIAVIAVGFVIYSAMRYLLDTTVAWPLWGKAAASWVITATLLTGFYRIVYGKWPHPADR